LATGAAVLFGAACASQSEAARVTTQASAPTTRPAPPATHPTPPPEVAAPADAATPEFAANAFPPPLPDTPWHKHAWLKDDCLRCHETGVQDAPRVRHRDLPEILLTAKCRTCHALEPGKPPRGPRPPAADEAAFLPSAFPPMIPASVSHGEAWRNESCLLCHETGNRGAPLMKHAGLPPLLRAAKCRSCHVQVRSGALPSR
jgi:cytochrome c5